MLLNIKSSTQDHLVFMHILPLQGINASKYLTRSHNGVDSIMLATMLKFAGNQPSACCTCVQIKRASHVWVSPAWSNGCTSGHCGTCTYPRSWPYRDGRKRCRESGTCCLQIYCFWRVAQCSRLSGEDFVKRLVELNFETCTNTAEVHVSVQFWSYLRSILHRPGERKLERDLFSGEHWYVYSKFSKKYQPVSERPVRATVQLRWIRNRTFTSQTPRFHRAITFVLS